MGLYRTNKNAKTGTEIECPVCHTKFKKRQYSQAFCCTRCKDKFHNRVDGDRHSSEWYAKKELQHVYKLDPVLDAGAEDIRLQRESEAQRREDNIRFTHENGFLMPYEYDDDIEEFGDN